jgi:hypothetical protein
VRAFRGKRSLVVFAVFAVAALSVGAGVVLAGRRSPGRTAASARSGAASTAGRKGKVLSQSPRPGKRLKNGARISLAVGKGPAKR